MNIALSVTPRCSAALFFADRLNRERGLRDDELAALDSITKCNGSRRMWTARDDRELGKMIRQGLTAVTIADQLKRTPHSVRSRIRDLKRRKAHGRQAEA